MVAWQVAKYQMGNEIFSDRFVILHNKYLNRSKYRNTDHQYVTEKKSIDMLVIFIFVRMQRTQNYSHFALV